MMEYMGITLADVERTLQAFGGNTSGGFADVHGTEFAIRNIGRTSSLDDMRSLVVSYREGVPVLLGQVGEVAFAAKVKRGDGTLQRQARGRYPDHPPADRQYRRGGGKDHGGAGGDAEKRAAGDRSGPARPTTRRT